MLSTGKNLLREIILQSIILIAVQCVSVAAGLCVSATGLCVCVRLDCVTVDCVTQCVSGKTKLTAFFHSPCRLLSLWDNA